LLTRYPWRRFLLLALSLPYGGQPAANIPRCRAAQIEMRVANAGVGMSHWAEGLEFRNVSADACFLRGVPKLVFLDDNSRSLPVPICPNCNDYLFPSRLQAAVVLRPRDSAHVLIGSSTAYDLKFCNRASVMQIFLPGESHPLMATEHELYYCVKIDVSGFLPGTIRDDTRRNGRAQPPSVRLWGPATQGIQVSLMPFAHWQRLGILGFHLALRGLGASSIPTRQCRSATLRMWQAGKIVQSVTSSNRLVCAEPAPPSAATAPGVVRTDVTTQEFGMAVNRSGMFEFDLVETLDGGHPLTLTSNRTSVVVTNN